jgi:cell division protein FtsI (penicillin-binding protein 3)/stage V sporulation protein D (sporulation-specific penicillin-binding protein)
VRWNARTRIALASGFLGLIFTGFSARLIDISVGRHNEYSEIAAQKNSIRQPIYARRGLIYDRNGEILADNAPIRTVVADGTRIEHPERVAEIAAPFLGAKAGELAARLRTDRRYVVLQRELPAETAFELAKALSAEKLHGIYFENDFKRVHPNGLMLCHVMGFLNHDRQGIQGVEASMEDYLAGQDGFRFTEHDRAGREIVVYRGQEREPRDGLNVTLTIDMGLQSIVEDELDAAVKQLKPKNAIAILVNPKTGEVLAMASRPNFEPDKIAEAQPEQMKNHAVIDMFEPGSTFKIVASSGALNEGVVDTETLVNCENGAFSYGGRVLRDTHHYGPLTVHDILMKSSNIGAAKLAMRMGDTTFYEYVKRFGFGERTGIELPGEIPGLVHAPSQWDKVTITRMPMGQSVAVTPLQAVMAMGVIANGGKLLAPHIVKSLSDGSGKVIKEFQPTVIRQVINPETAAIVSEALADVVSAQGTAPQAAVPGYRMAGKTGTAQIPKPGGGYYENKYLASFCGYMPAEDPAFVGIVMIDDANLPPNLNYGGLVSAPIYARIAARAARYLDLQPTMRALPITEVAAREDQEEESHR